MWIDICLIHSSIDGYVGYFLFGAANLWNIYPQVIVWTTIFSSSGYYGKFLVDVVQLLKRKREKIVRRWSRKWKGFQLLYVGFLFWSTSILLGASKGTYQRGVGLGSVLELLGPTVVSSATASPWGTPADCTLQLNMPGKPAILSLLRGKKRSN